MDTRTWNVQIRIWSWKHQAIREAIFTHRVTAGCIFQTSAATSVGKILGMQKIYRSLLRKAIVMVSWQIVTSSLLLRMIIGGIGHFTTHEDNTKETRSCPIVLRKQHVYMKLSNYRREAIVLKYDGIKMGSRCWWRQPNFSRYNACRMWHDTNRFELLMSFTCVMEPLAYKRQTSEHPIQSVLSNSTRQTNL